MRRDLRVAVYGLALGYILSWIGFTNYDEVHTMFALTDARLWLAFGFGAVLAGIGFRSRRGPPPNKRLHPGVIPGSLLFGLGWAITGVCPGAAWAQLGEGQLAAGVSLLGLLIGTWLYGIAHRRLFRWDRCTK